MRERIPMDTLLHNLQVGSISRVGHIAGIIETLKNTPVEDLIINTGEDICNETYGELAGKVMNNPPRNKDALIISMASSLLGMANPYRRRERNM